MISKNIMLVGEWNSSNLGDQILCACVEKIITHAFTTVNIIRFDISYGFGFKFKRKALWFPYRLFFKIFKNNDKRNVIYSHIKTKWIRHDLSRYHSTIDMIIFCGGQMFMDYFANQIEEVVNISLDRDIPIFWNACGAGKCNETSIKTFKSCLKNTLYGNLTVRDNQEFFFKFLKRNPILIPDAALSSSTFFKSRIKRQSSLIGIGIMNPDEFKQYHLTKKNLLSFFDILVRILIREGFQIELFTNGSPSDELFLKNVYKRLNIKEISIASCPKTGSDLINLICRYEKIISFRLHSHIVSYSYKIPSYGFIWDNKIRDFFKITRNENNTSELRNLDVTNVINFIKNGETSFDKLDSLKKQSQESIVSACYSIIYNKDIH